MEKETVNCNLCGKNDFFKIDEEKGFDIVCCNKCGLVYVNPRMSYQDYLVSLSKTYKELANEFITISKEKMDNQVLSDEEFYALKQKEALRDLKYIQKKVKSGKLLDAGCGQGHFLYFAKKNGFVVKGIEASQTHIPNEEFKIDYINKEFTDIGANEELKNSGKYNVITFFDVIEHTRDPKLNLKHAYDLLDKGGLIVIRVPNINYIKIKQWLLNMFLKEKIYSNKNIINFGVYIPETHLYNFSEKTMLKMLKQLGFKKIECNILPPLIIGTKLRSFSVMFYYLIAKILNIVTLGNINIGASMQFYAYK